jgi:predicted nucleic acid-binding protein
MNKAVIDSNVLIATIDSRDSLHAKAERLIERMTQQKTELLYFDCVLNETLSVFGRRLEEQKRAAEFAGLVERVHGIIPEPMIVWTSGDVQRLYPKIVDLMQQTSGRLNFHDALIALKCRELQIASLLSFDADFDALNWIDRLS